MMTINVSSSVDSVHDRLFWIIFLAVIAVHFAGILFSLLFVDSHPVQTKREKLVVKTISLNPHISTPISNPKQIAPSVVQEQVIEPIAEPVKVEAIPEPVLLPIEPVVVEVKPVEKTEEKSIQEIPKVKVEKVKEVEKPQINKIVKKTPVKKVEKKQTKEEVKKPTVAKVKEAPKKTVVENKAGIEKSSVSKAEEIKKRELIAKAQESIANIDMKRAKINPSRSDELRVSKVPGAIGSLHIDTISGDGRGQLSSHEMDYRDELASRLKLQLRLPEHGAVEVKLTLERSGRVSKVLITSSENKKNRQYIENRLKSLTFPSFGSNFEGLSQYTFLITLSNEL